jgi:hypothetical protein
MSKPIHTYASIWDTLHKLDVSDVIMHKNGNMYLQWMRAWSLLMDHYPEATFEFLENKSEPDGTMTVGCVVKIGDCQREMFLSVMTGFRNSAMPNPDSRCIGDNKMRCLVKCLAMFGLGACIFYGELCAPDSGTDLGTEVERFNEVHKTPENTGFGDVRSVPLVVEQVEQVLMEQQASALTTHLLQSPIAKTEAFEAGKYAFVNLYEFEQWVISKKGMRFEDLGHESRLRMIEFFGKYTSRNEWPIF